MKIERREFLATSLAVGTASFMGPLSAVAQSRSILFPISNRKYAPHFGMFQHHAGENLLDQLDFIAAQGFSAIEDTGLASRTPETQQAIGLKLAELEMTMGTFVACSDYGNPTFASGLPQFQKRVLTEIQTAADISKRTGARYCTIIPGKTASQLSIKEQTQNTIELLKQANAIAARADLTLLLEPLNHWPTSPELFLHSAQQAADICRAVNSPYCKILFDVPHQALTTPDFLEELEITWDQVGYLQVGDDRGRKEPGTGSIDYPRLLRFLNEKRFEGIIGMDHGNSLPGKQGELAVIDAYKSLETV